MAESVAVVGAGSWGTTLAKILAEKTDERVLLWARRKELCQQINEEHVNAPYLEGIRLPQNLEATDDLQRICESSLMLLIVVPSHGLRKVAFDMGDYLTGEHALVHGSKGIEEGSFKRMSQVLREETCVRKIGVLSGPNLARELCARQPAGTLVASGYAEVYQRCQAALHNDYFRVYGGTDVVGAEVGGAFKNIVALAAGVASGLELGENSKALLLTRGLNEMARLGGAMGAKMLTFGGMAGLGDLVATCSSPLSRNHRVGRSLGEGKTLEEILAEMKMVAEGVKTTKAVFDYARSNGIELPIVEAIYRLLYEGATVQSVISDLMALPANAEFSP